MASTGSRICVKNLPKYVAEDRLRDTFSQKGEVTDAKLMRTNDGKSRQFAFIGFSNQAEAEEAIKYFNNSFMDTRRITCEIACKIGDPNAPRPWSRYSVKKKEKSIGEAKDVIDGNGLDHASAKGKKNTKSSETDDPKLQEFLQVVQRRSESKLWDNDTLVALPVKQHRSQLKSDGGQKQTVSKMVANESDESKNGLNNSIMNGKSQNLVHDTAISDMEYFKSRVKGQWLDSESSDEDLNADNNNIEQEDDGDDDSLKNHPGKHVQNLCLEKEHNESVKDFHNEMINERSSFEESNGEVFSQKDQKDEVFETARLFVRNLPYVATEDDLEELFRKYGDVSQIHLVVDKGTKRSKGIAYVRYVLPEAALRALEELDNSIFQGRLLHVMPAKENVSAEKQVHAFESHSSNTLKQQRVEAKKASEVSGNTKAWNSLFMRSDTVVENIARKHGIAKSDLLDRDADDLAVRIALGETQVIEETKKALLNAGVNVASIENFATRKTDSMKRSNHVLLAKNLPYGSSESELTKMFGKFGSLDKIILPSTKALALIVFLEASEARQAFRGLAYKRYKDAPLYLEWAPGDIFSPNPSSESDPKDSAIVGERDAKKVFLEKTVEGISDMDLDPDRVESRSVFVKNLNFKTSDEGLLVHFSRHMKDGKIMSLSIKKHLKNEKKVSMGFGFIEFDSVETAANVCKDMQGTVLDGHALILQLCHVKKDGRVIKKGEENRSSTKLIVRNVAFEATKNDLLQLFSPFGQIKRLRMPRKFGKHRGFAFVEYVMKQEAQTAIQALSSTHLYGRHLVMERAKEGEGLEELRARTAAQFNGFQNPPAVAKKRKHSDVLDNDSMLGRPAWYPLGPEPSG